MKTLVISWMKSIKTLAGKTPIKHLITDSE